MPRLIARDVTEDMRRAIEKELEHYTGSPWVAGAVAVELVERLRRDDPELLNKWLEQQAVRVVREAIVGFEAAHRQQARAHAERQKPPSVFRKALTRYEETGHRKEVLAAWLDTTFIVTTGNQRKMLGDMTKDELHFAADRYQLVARTSTMQAAFLRALAERVGAKLVSEVFDEEELSRIWREIDRFGGSA